MLSIGSILLSVDKDGYRSHTARYHVTTKKKLLSTTKAQKRIEPDNQTGFPNAEFYFLPQCHNPRSASSEFCTKDPYAHEEIVGV